LRGLERKPRNLLDMALGGGKVIARAYKSVTHELAKVTHGSHEPMSLKSKVVTESGETWHHPRAIEAWLNN
jgi:hypothetical protein